MVNHNSVVCLMAPTASGKTDLAYQLYDSGRYEIISVDSALIYLDMDIGTAKPTKQELQDYPHHLVNIITPEQSYSVANFVQDVKQLIDDIHNRNKVPLLVGGTMMYFTALFQGLSNIPETDSKIRHSVEQWRQAEGIEALYQYLLSVDLPLAQRLHPTDTQRITRAVEVYQQTHKPLSQWQLEPKQALAHHPNQSWLGLAVMPDRAWLHERIALRLEMMWQKGLVLEVLSLLKKYSLSINMPSMRSVGYRQVLEYLQQIEHPDYQKYVVQDMENLERYDNDFSTKINTINSQHACQQMKNKALYATRQLAKRQYTWLKKLVKFNDHQSQLSILPFANTKEVKQYLI